AGMDVLYVRELPHQVRQLVLDVFTEDAKASKHNSVVNSRHRFKPSCLISCSQPGPLGGGGRAGSRVARQTPHHLRLDVGLDTGTPVDDKDYQVPFAFTGKLGKITIDLSEVVRHMDF